MPTIRVRDWTKARLDEIRERQNHSSHDSVVKTLLKDHELAAAREQVDTSVNGAKQQYEAPTDETEYAVQGMKVLEELETPKDNVGFLWCPNCNSEVAHFTFTEPSSFDDFETSCPQCFNGLDQHALVAIEIDYPLEQKLVSDELAKDLKTAVIDYWDRRLQETPTDVGSMNNRDRVERLVWEFDQYAKDFMWEWPTDVPVVGLESGNAYKNTTTKETIEILERVPKGGTNIDAFRVKRYSEGSGDQTDSELLESKPVCDLLRNRKLELMK